jgi:type II restriction/modification system DNA methylase subunit YeeA
MKKEKELDDEIINQIHKREDTNSALTKILENINKNDSGINKSEQKKDSLIKMIIKLFQRG